MSDSENQGVGRRDRPWLFFCGLFLVTAATLALQIIQTRILSVIYWYSLAFFVVSIAMFGMTAGAVHVYLRGRDAFSKELYRHLSSYTVAFALTAAASVIIELTLALTAPKSLIAAIAWLELSLCLAAPFYCSGVVVSLALTCSPYRIGRVYGVDLIGAAFGCFAVLALLNLSSGPSAVLWTSALIALGGVAFQEAGGNIRAAGTAKPGLVRLARSPGPVLVVLVLLALINSVTDRGIRPIVVKETTENPPAYERWNSFSRVQVGWPSRSRPSLWGPSPHLPAGSEVDQRFLKIDGLAGTAMYAFSGDVRELGFLAYDVTNLAYRLPMRLRVAIIGVGGGRDISSAKLFGAKEVVGVEVNPIFMDLLTSPKLGFNNYSPVAQLPGVRLVTDEARSWFARSDESFDLIQMSLVDTWAATGAGAYTLTENGLYTVEAWKIFLSHLTERGVFTVSRWFSESNLDETARMVSLAVAALFDEGIASPRDHIVLVAARNIATLIAARAPLSLDELAIIGKVSTDLGFTVILSPDRPVVSTTLERIVSSTDRRALEKFTAGLSRDLTPPTDDRPFFFNQLKFGNPLDLGAELLTGSFRDSGVVQGNVLATVTLGMIMVFSFGLVVAAIVLPLWRTVHKVNRVLALAGTGYFLLIGIGFMMVEIGLLQRLSVFLGQPVHSLSIVLFVLIAATGVGSWLSDGWSLLPGWRFPCWAGAICFYLATLSLWLSPLLNLVQSEGLPARAALAALVIAPAGLLMGFGFPTGMRLVTTIDSRPTPWFWGINGAASVLAASVAVYLSIAYGIDTTLLVSAVCYGLLPVPGLILARLGSRSPAAKCR